MVTQNFIFTDVLSKRVLEAQQWLAKKILDDCYMLTPVDTGALRNTPEVRPDGSQIRYTVPYAYYMYRGTTGPPNFKPFNYQSPTAVDHWFQKAYEVHSEEWVQGVADMITKGKVR